MQSKNHSVIKSMDYFRSVFDVKGMSCGACVMAVEKTVLKLNGVKQVAVALLTEKAEV